MGKKDKSDNKASEKCDPCKPRKKEDPSKIRKTSPCVAKTPEKTKKLQDSTCKPSKPGKPSINLRKLSSKDLLKYLPAINSQERIQQLKKQFLDIVAKSPGYFKSQLAKVNKENMICLVKCSKKYIEEFGTMADKPGSSVGRPMKFPYTFSAKFAQFPLKYYISNQWIWKYYFISVVACVPVFYSIQKLANSPENVAKWAEIRRKEAAEHHH